MICPKPARNWWTGCRLTQNERKRKPNRCALLRVTTEGNVQERNRARERGSVGNNVLHCKEQKGKKQNVLRRERRLPFQGIGCHYIGIRPLPTDKGRSETTPQVARLKNHLALQVLRLNRARFCILAFTPCVRTAASESVVAPKPK